MARALAKRVRDDEVHTRMDHLARFIAQLDVKEIWSLLDSLFPGLPEDDKEDLYGMLICKQREQETKGRSASDVFAELETERGLNG